MCTLWHQLRFQNVKAENVVFGQFRTLIEIITVFLAVIKFLQLTFLLSDPNHTLWHQLRFQNVRAGYVVFGQFWTLNEIIAVFLAFIKILKIRVILPDIDYIP